MGIPGRRNAASKQIPPSLVFIGSATLVSDRAQRRVFTNVIPFSVTFRRNRPEPVGFTRLSFGPTIVPV